MQRLLSLLGLLVACGGHAASPVRVVSQTVGSDELLLALAEPGQVAALSHLATSPEFSAVAEEAKNYPKIALGDAETILRFKPTLVLAADYSRPELIEQVRRAGVQVISFDHYLTLADTYTNLRLLARELGGGAPARAERIVADCEARVRALADRLAGAKPVPVIAPSTYGIVGGAGTTFQDQCDHAGAINLAATLGKITGHQAPPNEQMLTWSIDMVVVAGPDTATALAPYRELPPYQFMAAVRDGRAALLKPWMLSSVSHHRVDAYETLARALHPEAFR